MCDALLCTSIAPSVSCYDVLLHSRRGPPTINWQLIAHLWDKHQTQYHSGTEDNKERC